MALVIQRRTLRASRPWSYSLVDDIDYKQYLSAAQNVHEISILTDEMVRQKIVGDRQLAQQAIITQRATERQIHGMTAVGGMVAGSISRAVEHSGNSVSSAIGRSGEANVDAIREASAANVEQLVTINASIRDLRSSIDFQSQIISFQSEILAEGFSELVAALGDINASLKNLLAVAKSPSHTWALEQFEMARQAFHLRLDDEALKILDRAINGFGSQTGYSLEPRFHYLLGTITMGGIDRPDTNSVNLQIAESAFLRAASVIPDHSKAKLTKGRCLVAAAQAALFQRAPERTLQHAMAAIRDNPLSGDAHFIRAKVEVASGQHAAATESLQKAFMADGNLAIRALADADIGVNTTALTDAIEKVSKAIRQPIEKIIDCDPNGVLEAVLSYSGGDRTVNDMSSKEIIGLLKQKAPILVASIGSVRNSLSDANLLSLVEAQNQYNIALKNVVEFSDIIDRLKVAIDQFDRVINETNADISKMTIMDRIVEREKFKRLKKNITDYESEMKNLRKCFGVLQSFRGRVSGFTESHIGRLGKNSNSSKI